MEVAFSQASQPRSAVPMVCSQQSSLAASQPSAAGEAASMDIEEWADAAAAAGRALPTAAGGAWAAPAPAQGRRGHGAVAEQLGHEQAAAEAAAVSAAAAEAATTARAAAERAAAEQLAAAHPLVGSLLHQLRSGGGLPAVLAGGLGAPLQALFSRPGGWTLGAAFARAAADPLAAGDGGRAVASALGLALQLQQEGALLEQRLRREGDAGAKATGRGFYLLPLGYFTCAGA
jgi:hypothetical protein